MNSRTAGPTTPSATTSTTRSFVAAVYAFAVVMLGTTMPTPLYAIYGEQLGFGVATTTVIYAVYAAGVIAALILFGRWSDVVGRRRLLIAGAALSAVSAVVFLTAGPVWQMLIGRVISGMSAGIYAGAATTAIIELAPPSWRGRAPAVATAANIGGLGLGPLIAGVLAQYAPAPLHTPFAVDLALLALAFAGIWRLTETVAVKPGARLGIQRLSVPADMRAVFTRASIAAFAGFAVTGTFTGVAPTFLSSILGIDNLAFAGVVVFAVFASSAVTQIVVRRMPTDTALVAGCAILIGGTCLSTAGLVTASAALVVAGAMVSGIGQGMSFSKGLASVVAAAPHDRRAEVTSTFFVVAYVGISIPIVGEGLTARAWGLQEAGIVFNAGAAVLALLSLILTVAAVRRAG
ncbi:putative drug resistance protein [Gordonia paraffinivorans NBRC 108238]|uniref:Drug resistance protein n=2 Tax=Gordonia paraffinivorans TaxID=175628 RepID=A0ABQ0IIQ1_9ACTN|nr:MFS transporter [Gordonia paraffinivorans]GAC83476.1 putative drug resistance protein [Gordonia paraffinivorans NBRC 108238]VFA87933.1 multidrug efflux system translocase MdfA [Gordonia paraffinivorans]